MWGKSRGEKATRTGSSNKKRSLRAAVRISSLSKMSSSRTNSRANNTDTSSQSRAANNSFSSAAGLKIEIGGKSMDIFAAQRAVARLLRSLQKQKLLKMSHAIGHWKNYNQFLRIRERTGVMVATRQLEFFISTGLQEVRDMIGCDRATLFMRNEETGDLWSAKADGLASSFCVPAGSGIVGSVVASGKPDNIRNAYRDSRFNSSFDKNTGYHTRTILCYPIWGDMKGEEGKSSEVVLGAVQFVNKYDGHFNSGDERTAEQLTVFLANVMMENENQANMQKVSNQFNAWSLKQRKTLIDDRAYGNIIETFLTQACLLSGADLARFIHKGEEKIVSLGEGVRKKRGSFTRAVNIEEWMEPCNYGRPLTSKVILTEVRRARRAATAHILIDNLEAFEHYKYLEENDDSDVDQSMKGRRTSRSGSSHNHVDHVIVVPLGASHKSTDSSLQESKSATTYTKEKSASSQPWSVAILQYSRRFSGKESDLNYHTNRVAKVVERLFNKMAGALYDRSLSRHNETMAMLGDVRSWVRHEIHKQAKDHLLNAQLGPAHRKINALTQSLADMSSNSNLMEEKLAAALAAEQKARDDTLAYKKQLKELTMQRNILAEQVVSLSPLSEALSKENVEATFHSLNQTLEEKETIIQELRTTLDSTKTSSTDMQDLRSRIKELEEVNRMQELKLKDFAATVEVAEAAQNALGSRNAMSTGLRRFVQSVENEVAEYSAKNVHIQSNHRKGKEESKEADSMIYIQETPDLRAVIIQAVKSVLSYDPGVPRTAAQMNIATKAVVEQLANAEVQLRFLPKCQRQLVETKRKLAKMQVRQTTLARQKQRRVPLAARMAERFYYRKILNTWRVHARNLRRERDNKERKNLRSRVIQNLAKSLCRKAFNSWKDLWHENMTTRMQMRRALACFFHRRYLLVWNRWCEYINFRQSARRIVRRTWLRASKLKEASAWRAWMLFTRAANRELEIVSHAANIMRNRLVASCFRAWLDRLQESRRHGRLLHRCIKRLQHRHVSMLFSGWVNLVQEQRQIRTQVHRVIASLSRQKISRAFRKWISVMDMLERQMANAHRIMKRWLLAGATRCFRRWHEFSTESKTQKQLLRRALARIGRRKLCWFFLNWKKAAVDLKHGKALLLRILTRWDRKMEVQCLRQWQWWSQLKAKQQHIANRVLARWLQEALHRSFARWHANAHQQRIERQLVKRAAARFTHRHLAHCFAGWRDTHFDLLDARELLYRILTRWDRKLETNAFRHWIYYISIKRRQDAVVSKVLMRWKAEAVTRAFSRWRENASEKRVQRQLCRRALSRISHRIQFTCFRSWHAAAIKLATDRRLARRALTRFTHSSLHRAFTSWRDAVQNLLEARWRVINILTRWDRKQETHAFRHWAAVTRLEARQENVISRIMFRWRSGLMHRSFNRWQSESRRMKTERQLARKALARFVHTCMHAAFQSWKVMVANVQAARSLTRRILTRWDRKQETHAFRHWAATVRLLARQEHVAGRILWRWSQLSLHRTFNCWHDNAHANRINRQLSIRALLRYKKRTMRTFFSGWIHYVEDNNWLADWMMKQCERIQSKALAQGLHILSENVRMHNLRQDGLYRVVVTLNERRNLRYAMRIWRRHDDMILCARNAKVEAAGRLRFFRYIRSSFYRLDMHRIECRRERAYESMSNSRANRFHRQRILRKYFGVLLLHKENERVRKIEIHHVLTGICVCAAKKSKLQAWRIWRLFVAQYIAQKHMAEIIMCKSMLRRRNHARIKKAMFAWSLHVLGRFRERHHTLSIRFRKAGVKGELAEFQWVIGKWQLMATSIQHRRMANLEKEHFLRHIRAENARLREVLVEYHRRGMFILDGSKDYIVQRKIAPSLKVDDYDSVDTMIQSSYHTKELAGVKVDNMARPAFSTHGSRDLQQIQSRPSSDNSREVKYLNSGLNPTLSSISRRGRSLLTSRGPDLPASKPFTKLLPHQSLSSQNLKSVFVTPPKTYADEAFELTEELTDEEIRKAIQKYNDDDIRQAIIVAQKKRKKWKNRK